MLIDIIKMPPLFGIPITRLGAISRVPITEVQRIDGVAYHPGLCLHHPITYFGSHISTSPSSVYKAIHLSHDSRFAFETVFTVEDGIYVCVYTKIISGLDVKVAISTKAIAFHQDLNHEPKSIVSLVGGERKGLSESFSDHPMFHNSVTDNLVPPIFGKNNLISAVLRISDIKSADFKESRLGFVYKPIYDYEPGLMVALIDGRFENSPFNALKQFHPSVSIPQSKWFKHEEISFAEQARGLVTHVNHEQFDNIALAAINLDVASFNITATLAHVVEGISACWLYRDYDDIYQNFLSGSQGISDQRKRDIGGIALQATLLYCKMYDIDHQTYMAHSQVESSITITKNIHDEIAISFHDLIHDHYVCFYTSFASIALATLAVGSGGIVKS